MPTAGFKIKAGNVAIVLTVIALIAVFALGSHIIETVEQGTYHIKQAAITGEMSAKMEPGLYGQWFGDITVWPVSETFFFTADKDGTDDIAEDLSIEVRFNDGSLCKISGTLRVVLPTTELEAIGLTTKLGFRRYKDMQAKLILPTIRNALRRTANLMSARESYSDKRADFVAWSRDQTESGLYVTEDSMKKVKDPISGELITKTLKVIRTDENGKIIREANPLEGTGITLRNFEIKTFVYEKKVQAQISQQQEALMAVATARANALKAEQEALTEEAKGKAAVMKAKYKEEEKKITVETQAAAEKAVAVIAGEMKKEVAALERDAALLEKEKLIALGEGESKRKRLVMEADGALEKKLAAYIKVQEVWATAFQSRKVPQLVMGGGGSGNQDVQTSAFAQSIQLLTLKAMGLKLDVQGGNTTAVPQK